MRAVERGEHMRAVGRRDSSKALALHLNQQTMQFNLRWSKGDQLGKEKD